MERFEKIYGTNPSKLLSFNVIDIGALSTELILWFSQEAGHNVPTQYKPFIEIGANVPSHSPNCLMF